MFLLRNMYLAITPSNLQQVKKAKKNYPNKAMYVYNPGGWEQDSLGFTAYFLRCWGTQSIG